MAKGKRQKTYESGGQQIGNGPWYNPKPPKLSKKDQLRKMIQDNKKR